MKRSQTIKNICSTIAEEILFYNLQGWFPGLRRLKVKIKRFRPRRDGTAETQVIYTLFPYGEVLRTVYVQENGDVFLAGDAEDGIGVTQSWARMSESIGHADLVRIYTTWPEYRFVIDLSRKAAARSRYKAVLAKKAKAFAQT